MRKLILKMSMSIDGFIGGPNGEMDWVLRSRSPEGAAWTVATLASAGLHAMGRTSWEGWTTFYPTATTPFAPAMNAIPKVVFTRGGLTRPAATPAGDPDIVRSWTHPRVAAGDLAAHIARLKEEPGGDILAHGGASFAQSLVQLDLVDEYKLVIHPVVLGHGLPLFAQAKPFDLTLVDAVTFPKGVVAHVYARAEA